ncbi:hypothetical protein MKZ38_009782 [Zalerion maritima]|uniref:C2H2-type domain-containing protein n=1 Tax=Zalerion maritima TaxID=339359 RepID=A0AAD5WVA6_9PEZI|nr:hypothetical protein MKZ38_009782 [Zalerion maritima]
MPFLAGRRVQFLAPPSTQAKYMVLYSTGSRVQGKVWKSLLQNREKLGYFQSRIAESERCEKPLTAEELQHFEEQGNQRKPLRDNHSRNCKVNIARSQTRWEGFATFRQRDWKELVKEICWEKTGIIDSFLRWACRRDGSRIQTYSALQRYLLQTWAVYKKYTGYEIDSRVKKHGETLARQLADLYGLRREPAHKNSLGPGTFTYLAYFRIVRDRSTFNIGLDRLDDMTIRLFQMFAGVRTHELVYEARQDDEKMIGRYHNKDDAFADIELIDKYIQPRPKACWVCDEIDDRTTAAYKVLCWEDIILWILRDPEGKGRDCLAMQILFRFHKGENKEIRPTFYLFVEENLPLICPVLYIFAKALAEEVIGISGYDRAENVFNTKISLPAVRIPWKREFWHKPVFRRSEKYLEGYEKVAEPTTRKMYDNPHYRQSVRNQAARHQPNSAVYKRYYHNNNINAVFQDAFLGRGTASPYLTILNHLGLICDENAPTAVPDELMRAIGPDAATRKLEERMSALRARLEPVYGQASRASGCDKEEYDQLVGQLRAARQKHRRKFLEIIRKDYFQFRNDRELENQLEDICEPERPPPEPVIFSLPERKCLAEILGDLDDNLPEEALIRRKINAINAWVDYAWIVEPKETDLPMQHGMPSLPDPARIGIDQDTALQNRPLSPQPLTPRTPNTPPPPYTESILPVSTSKPSIDRRQASRKRPVPCIFCGKCFSRVTTMWSHVDDHLGCLGGGHVPCPFPECKARQALFEFGHAFKSHVYHDHHVALRPEKPDFCGGSDGGANQQKPTIVLVNRRSNSAVSEVPSTPTKIILRAGIKGSRDSCHGPTLGGSRKGLSIVLLKVPELLTVTGVLTS